MFLFKIIIVYLSNIDIFIMLLILSIIRLLYGISYTIWWIFTILTEKVIYIVDI